MENRAFIKVISCSLLGILLGIPNLSFAYEPQTTHKALTREIIRFFNYSSDAKISDAERDVIMQGSVDEDAGARALHHFYDPINRRGLTIGNQEFLAAKYWGQDTIAQASSDPVFGQRMFGGLFDLFSSKTDFSWDRAVYEYAWGDGERGLKTLGHILHLIEDMAVPDHTRNDAHPPYADAVFHQSSPYEHWADKWNADNLNTADTLIKGKRTPFYCNHLSTCFDSMALYSNQNFFSKDTILKDYDLPKISNEKNIKLSNGATYVFGYNKDALNNDEFPLIQIKVEIDPKTGKDIYSYFLKDPDNLILSSYFFHLSRQAVLRGAGVVKLFFDEVAKEKQTKVLYEKNKSWVTKQWDKAKDGIFGFAGLLYGTSVTSNDLADVATHVPASVTLPDSTLPAQALVEFAVNEPNPPKPPALPVPPKVSEKAEGPAKSAQENPDQKIATDTALPPPHALVANTPDSLPGIPAKPDNAFGDSYKGASSDNGSGSSSGNTDTTAPDVSVTVTECGSTLASSGCAVTATTLNVRWSSTASDLASFDVTCTIGSTVCSGFPLSATTATSTAFSASDNRTYVFVVTARDTAGNGSSAATQTVEVQTHPIVINEVGWSGTPASADDEFIELYNNASSTISLSGFVLYSETDMGPYISLSGTIAPHGYYLIERGSDTAISNISADMVNSFGSGSSQGLSIFGENLALSYASTTIDHLTSNCLPSGWCAGDSSAYSSMERVDSRASGDTSSNWASNIGYVQSGKDSSGAYFANSARAKNSRLRLISQSGTVSSDTTLTAANSPYIMNGQMTVSSGVTLQAEPGVIIKFTNNNFTLSINGTLKFLGSSGNPVVVTSISDDTYGGDSSNNGTTSPPIGDWRSIVFNAGSSNSSILDYTTIRYGGTMIGGAQSAMVYVNNASPTIQNSTLEHGDAYGIRLINATSTIQNTTINDIRDSTVPYHSAIYIEGGAPSITGSTMASSTYGIAITNGSTAVITSNTFTNNTWAAMYSSISYPTVSGNTASGNSINGMLLEGTLTRDYTLPANANFPNVISSGGLSTSASTTLTIPAGAVVKTQTTNAPITIAGALNVTGTSGSHVVFTSLSDDARGGDTNNNGASSGTAGEWGGFSVTGTGTSTIAYAEFLYGAKYTPGYPKAALKVSNGTATISNSLFQRNDNRGLWLSSANGSTVSNSTFDNQTTAVAGGIGIYLENTAVTFDTLTVTNNTTGVDSTGSTVTSVGTHTFSGNTTNKNPANLF